MSVSNEEWFAYLLVQSIATEAKLRAVLALLDNQGVAVDPSELKHQFGIEFSSAVESLRASHPKIAATLPPTEDLNSILAAFFARLEAHQSSTDTGPS